jgi:hypothetical protein
MTTLMPVVLDAAVSGRWQAGRINDSILPAMALLWDVSGVLGLRGFRSLKNPETRNKTLKLNIKP